MQILKFVIQNKFNIELTKLPFYTNILNRWIEKVEYRRLSIEKSYAFIADALDDPKISFLMLNGLKKSYKNVML